MTNKYIKPFIKWAGGKRRLLPELLPRFPNNYNDYHEPFLGGGSVFLGLMSNIPIFGGPSHCYISDINPELINSYVVVRDNPEELIKILSEYKEKHSKEFFYELRNMDRDPNFNLDPITSAARMIYINKSCFNGLYRQNSKGQLCSSFGYPKNLDLLYQPDVIRECSRALQNCTISSGTYDIITPVKGDFVYLDPPYIPLTETAKFVSYYKDGFNDDDQIRLRDFCKDLDANGIYWMQSNSSADKVKELYSEFNIEYISARRTLGASGESRIRVMETIITNY